MDEKQIISSIEGLEKTSLKRDSALSDYLKHLLLLASSMFAILIAFQSNNIENKDPQLFLLSVIMLAFCIFTGAIALYSPLYATKNILKEQKKALVHRLRGGRTDGYLTVKSPKIFIICEWLCYITFLLSIVSLSIYTITRVG